MSDSDAVPWGRVVATVLLLALGLAGLAMTVCGALVAISSVSEPHSIVGGFLIIALVALAIGATCAYFAYRGITDLFRDPQDARLPDDWPPPRA